jgi:hypothetical protein
MLNLPCATRNRSLIGGEGRLQAAHLSGPRRLVRAVMHVIDQAIAVKTIDGATTSTPSRAR